MEKIFMGLYLGLLSTLYGSMIVFVIVGMGLVLFTSMGN